MSKTKLILFCVILSIILLTRIVIFYQNQPVIPIGKEVSLLGKIVSEPKFSGNFQNLQLESDLGVRVYVTILQNEEYSYGEEVSVVGSLEKRMLNNNREIYTLYLPQVVRVKNSTSPILAVVNVVRQKITSFYNENLPPDLASLLLGIVFGIKVNISKDFLQNLQAAGVTHVIAASGMNVTLVGGFLSAFLILFLKRQWAIVLTILGLLFYALLAGFQPSILRATIMGILVFTSQIVGRQTIASYGLFLAAFLILFISPNLVLDVGFQLSFAATAGLLYLRPLIDLLFSNNFIKKLPISEDLFTTVAAQATTLPILLANFGNYSPWSIVANVLVLWTIPILMILGGVGVILGLIFAPIGQLFVYLCLPLLWYFEKIVKLFPVINSSQLQSIHWTLVIGYYLILLSFVLLFKIRNKQHANKNK